MFPHLFKDIIDRVSIVISLSAGCFLFSSRPRFISLLRPRADERGSGILEYALIAPFLFFLILGFINLARYLAAQSLLSLAAQRGLQKAVSTPNLDLDITGLEPAHPEYESFVQARRRVCNVATSFLTSTLFSPSETASSYKLREYEITDYAANGAGSAPSHKDDCAVLRPGERAKIVALNTYVNHPTLAPDSAGHPPSANPKILMKRHYLYVEVSADIELYFPFMRTATLTGKAVGERQEIAATPDVVDAFNPTDVVATTTTTTSSTSSTSSTTTSSTTTTTACPPNWNSAFQTNQCPLTTPGPGGFCAKGTPCPDFGPQ